MVDFIFRNGKQVAMTSDEIAERNAKEKEWLDKIDDVKLNAIREIRNQKLSETDYLALSDNVMSEEMKTYRKNLRNIPQDYSADKYDDLFAKDEQGKLTHSVWSKP